MVIRSVQGEGLEREWRALEQMSPNLLQAVLAAEDARFCAHSGFDWVELEKAVRDYSDGGGLRGASTISMQTAKNLFLWPSRSFFRKAAEAALTVPLELLWPKHRILEVYLNIAEWGPGVYGAEAASRRAFGKAAGALGRREAALLAAVLPNPRQRSAARPSAYVRARAELILRRMDAVAVHDPAPCPP
jgi:monofunctional biosynthetic peptidoglycan transglycosylase